ncbi:SRPBCC family protein [Lyngbya confervoides]|uniref:SRPBCC family protein n=1 Tax=Lyngbya confervoides BDU141951 TaxID=1574623 RepID=A0ABD4SXM0_9CYAN|nr:SRPBCC family protein [Lyngbya confervoides]MCM1981347.1 SRPBCC family protein [Lyngbya confervoides BDU141951]
MSLPFWLRRFRRQPYLRWKLVKTYRAISAASVETIWGKLSDVTDVSWHPLLVKTDVPFGLQAKPGLIYRAMNRWIPVPCRMFVEKVNPNQFISIRILAFPGLEERVTYQLSSDVKGTFISYSVMLRGWLTPLVWSFLRGPAEKVATRLASAAETDGRQSWTSYWRSHPTDF